MHSGGKLSYIIYEMDPIAQITVVTCNLRSAGDFLFFKPLPACFLAPPPIPPHPTKLSVFFLFQQSTVALPQLSNPPGHHLSRLFVHQPQSSRQSLCILLFHKLSVRTWLTWSGYTFELACWPTCLFFKSLWCNSTGTLTLTIIIFFLNDYTPSGMLPCYLIKEKNITDWPQVIWNLSM